MPENLNKHCPVCGKRPIDRRLVQCPDCRVPFAYDGDPPPAATPASQPQLGAGVVAKEILGSAKFWAGFALLIAAAAFGVVKFTEQRANDHLTAAEKEYFNALDQRASNQVHEQISRQISNQVAAEFRQPRIKSAIEQAAADRAQDLLTNAVWPALDAFRAQLDLASAQLAKSSNDLAQVSRDIKLAGRAASQMAPAPADAPALLSLTDHTVSQNGTNYVLTLILRPTNPSRPVGTVDLIAGTYRQTAKVVNFSAQPPNQSDPPIMNETGDAARLTFNATGVGLPVVIELDVTAPTVVRITGDVLEEDLTIPIASEKMVLPPDAK